MGYYSIVVCVQPKYSWEANLYATRWFCADRREQQWKIIASRTCQYFRVYAIQKLKIHLIAHYSNARSLWKGRPALRCHVQNMSNASALRQAVMSHCYRLILRLNFLVTVELLNDQAGGDFVQCQTEMRAFAVRIYSEFKQIEINWNRIVHQNALWSLVFSTTRQQTNLRAGCKSLQPGTMTSRRSETFQELLYLFSSEDKYKGFYYLYQGEDWRIDWNQL